jgi:hypothetical protein
VPQKFGERHCKCARRRTSISWRNTWFISQEALGKDRRSTFSEENSRRISVRSSDLVEVQGRYNIIFLQRFESSGGKSH